MFSFGNKTKCVKTGVATPVSETKASLTIQTALKLESKLLGDLGNYITVKAVSSGVAAMSISNLAGSGTQADPYLIEIKLGTTVTNNTMTLIAAAIAAKTDVNAIVNAIVITGATQMTVFAVVPLVGGLNGSVGYLGEVRFDANMVEWSVKHSIDGCYYWCTNKNYLPGKDTEYMTDYDFITNKPVYSQYREITTSATGGNVTVAHGVVGISKTMIDLAMIGHGGLGSIPMPFYYTAELSYAIPSLSGNAITVVTTNTATINSKLCRILFSYQR